ncbi:hypothetical protein NIA71_19710 [Ihubacter massiliensis]|uniref:hypothetical protein n=1 Tax=Ihubacter massiliensis TaxID=1852367 RepID=UPI00209724EA|nr:hypothetical protein [Ihubacter massiliensis]MCO7124148.1 hypothetical protein [Ihubacter massiliensis]MDY3013519.1 hypothetical protein [Clostridiales Family XIII bacterium]
MATKLTQTEIIQRVLDCKEALGLNTLPLRQQLKEMTGLDSNLLSRVGGLKGLSEMTGIPMAPNPRRAKAKVDDTPVPIRPSRADKIEAEMRKQGLSYKDWQTADTLKRVDGVAW